MAKQIKQLMTERSESNVELETLRQHIRSIVSTLPDVVWSVIVPSREICYVSDAVATVFGRTADEIYANTIGWGDFIHPDDRLRVLDAWDRAAQGGIFEAEYRTLTKSGETRWIHSRGHTATDSDGKVVRMDGISRDITKWREQERKIGQLSRLHAVLSKINSTIVRVRNREDLFQEACRLAVEQGGFGMVWIGLIDRAKETVRAVAGHGFDMDKLDEDFVSLNVKDTSPSGLVSQAIEEKKPVYVNDIALAPPKTASGNWPSSTAINPASPCRLWLRECA